MAAPGKSDVLYVLTVETSRFHSLNCKKANGIVVDGYYIPTYEKGDQEKHRCDGGCKRLLRVCHRNRPDGRNSLAFSALVATVEIYLGERRNYNPCRRIHGTMTQIKIPATRTICGYHGFEANGQTASTRSTPARIAGVRLSVCLVA